MAAFTIKAVFHDGNVMEVATTVTAAEALASFRVALKLYRRAWVTSESGDDLAEVELTALAAAERRE